MSGRAEVVGRTGYAGDHDADRLGPVHSGKPKSEFDATITERANAGRSFRGGQMPTSPSPPEAAMEEG